MLADVKITVGNGCLHGYGRLKVSNNGTVTQVYETYVHFVYED